MSGSGNEPLGGLAAEARRLVEALGDWASTRLGAADEQFATGSPECQLCPVCQLLSALRGDRPEMLARLDDAWTAFLGALAGHSHPAASSDASDSGSGAGSTPGDPIPETPLRPVQNIDVR